MISALFTILICAQVIDPFARIVAGPVADTEPPTLVPSKINMSVAPVDDGLELPVPFNDVFQFDPVLIKVADAVPPTQ
jgi:hypothetical protein